MKKSFSFEYKFLIFSLIICLPFITPTKLHNISLFLFLSIFGFGLHINDIGYPKFLFDTIFCPPPPCPNTNISKSSMFCNIPSSYYSKIFFISI